MLCAGGGSLHNGNFFLPGGIAQFNQKQKAIQLGFRQGVSTLLFHRVLCCQNKERLGQELGFAHGGNAAFLHGFQQGALGFGRGAVDFVCQQNLGKQRTLLKDQLAVCVQHFRSQYVARHQIRRKLNASKLQTRRLGQTLHQSGFCQPRNANQQGVPVAQHGHDDQVNGLLLTHNGLFNLRAKLGYHRGRGQTWNDGSIRM